MSLGSGGGFVGGRAGCSQYVTADMRGGGEAAAASPVRLAAEAASPPMLYNTTFAPEALPLRDHAAHEAAASSPPELLEYLYDAVLQPARVQGSCGSCYSFSISAAIAYSLALTYRRLGGYFAARYISQQYIVTCYEVEGAICGCNGGDLAKALAYLKEHGVPTFVSFPYVNGADDVTPEASNHYLCEANLQRGNSLGTCAPCQEGEPSYETAVSRAELDSGLFSAKPAVQVKASCLPCASVGGPLYYPQPCRIYDPAKSLEENVEVAKRLLGQYGPLCTALRVNQAEFLKLGARQPLFPLAALPVYAPSSAPELTAPLHAVLVVGYSDLDRESAVWICRNSWGDHWGAHVADAPALDLDAHGAIIHTRRTLGGLFLVSMYHQTTVTAVLEHSVGICGVLTKAPGDAAPRSPRLGDAFVLPLPFSVLAELRRRRVGPGVAAAGPRRAWLAAGMLLLVGGVAAGLFLLVALWLG